MSVVKDAARDRSSLAVEFIETIKRDLQDDQPAPLPTGIDRGHNGGFASDVAAWDGASSGPNRLMNPDFEKAVMQALRDTVGGPKVSGRSGHQLS